LSLSAFTAVRLATIYIDGAHSLDWEDIACGPCPLNTGGHCIYVADTGGNAGGDANTIYRIREPTEDLLSANGKTIHVQMDAKLEFRYVWAYVKRGTIYKFLNKYNTRT